MKRILLLGSTGFIGQHLYLELKSGYEVLCLLNKSAIDVESLNKYNPDIVINAAASLANSDFETSLEANFAFPSRILEGLGETSQGFTWIQLGSYFELQVPFGRTDWYSIHKKEFTEFLKKYSVLGKVKECILYLPHITGTGEKPKRLFSTLLKSFEGEKVYLKTSGEQFIPILSIWDCVKEVKLSLHNRQGEFTIKPVFYNSLSNLVELYFNGSANGEVIFNKFANSVDSKYPKLIMEETIRNLTEDVPIEQIISKMLI